MSFKLPEDNVVGPNCGVTCVAIAAGVSFKKAWNALHNQPINRYARWKGKTRQPEREAVLSQLGVKFKKLTLTNGCTLKTFIERHTRTGKIYMVRTTGHVQMVKDGIILDQNGPHDVDGWRARKRVKDVLLIGE